MGDRFSRVKVTSTEYRFVLQDLITISYTPTSAQSVIISEVMVNEQGLDIPDFMLQIMFSHDNPPAVWSSEEQKIIPFTSTLLINLMLERLDQRLALQRKKEFTYD